jgi:hypothetical protein
VPDSEESVTPEASHEHNNVAAKATRRVMLRIMRGWFADLLGTFRSTRDSDAHAQGGPMSLDHRKTDDGSHFVAINALKVLLFRDGDHWIAQSLELDYAAAGESIADVKHRFTEGLCLTIGEHIKKYESIEHLVRPAPPEIWQRYFLEPEYSRVQSVEDMPMVDCGRDVPALRRLAFLEPSHA